MQTTQTTQTTKSDGLSHSLDHASLRAQAKGLLHKAASRPEEGWA